MAGCIARTRLVPWLGKFRIEFLWGVYYVIQSTLLAHLDDGTAPVGQPSRGIPKKVDASWSVRARRVEWETRSVQHGRTRRSMWPWAVRERGDCPTYQPCLCDGDGIGSCSQERDRERERRKKEREKVDGEAAVTAFGTRSVLPRTSLD